MKSLLILCAAVALVMLIGGCASTSGGLSSSSGPTISGSIDTSVGTRLR